MMNSSSASSVLVVAAIGLPMVGAVFFLLGIVSDMYRAQMLILNVPFP